MIAMNNKKEKMLVFLFTLCASSTSGASLASAKEPCVTGKQLRARFGGNQQVTRCGGPLSSRDCATVNDLALGQGIVCQDGIDWLVQEGLCAITFGDELYGVCPKGCFEAGTMITTLGEGSEFTSIPARDVSSEDRLATLGAGTSLDAPDLVPGQLKKTTFGPEELGLFVFQMVDGTELSVTSDHPMVLSDGSIVRAKEVEVGGAFVKSNGQEVEIVQVSRRSTQEDVFNFDLVGDSTEEHVMVANDIFVGDLRLQANTDSELASIALRSN